VSATITVNRWPCKHLEGTRLEGAFVLATIRRGDFSRLALCLPHVTYVSRTSHLPEDDRYAELTCIGHLCASGQACANHLPWVLGYLFDGFAAEKL
jgi:hypothetical protein